MSDYTNNLNLLKKDPQTDGNDYFNIQTMLNDNWDKIDAAVAAKETTAGAQAKVDNLAGSGRTTQTVKGNADAIAALNQTVASHSVEDGAHGAVSAATANKIIRRDAAGRAKVAAPSAADDIARKDTVDAVQTYLTTHTSAAAPHSGHITHSLATAVNDFLVASGAGAFVKKTLAEVKTILGLGSVAYLSNVPIANGGTGATTAAAALTNLGLTATAAELNYTDGVTSNIQTQLNAKLGLSGGNMTGDINMQDNQLIRPDIQDYSEVVGTTPVTTGTCNFDLTTGNVFAVTPTEAITIGVANPPASGKGGSVTIWLTNGATVYAKTFAPTIKWVNDEIPDMSLASKTYGIVLTTINGGTAYRAACVGPYSA